MDGKNMFDFNVGDRIVFKESENRQKRYSDIVGMHGIIIDIRGDQCEIIIDNYPNPRSKYGTWYFREYEDLLDFEEVNLSKNDIAYELLKLTELYEEDITERQRVTLREAINIIKND